MTRISKCIDYGELWDRVVLENGIVGYAFRSYLAEVPKINISKINILSEKNKINKNERINLQIETLPKDAEKQRIIFESSNTSVALVDNKGVVLGVGAGNAIITAKTENGDVSESINIEVYSPVTGIKLIEEEKRIKIGDNYKINAIVEPNDANNKKLIYSSTNEEIATVEADGTINGKAKGNIEIIVSTEEGNFEKRVKLTILDPIPEEELRFNKDLRVENNEISNLVVPENKVKQIIDKIETIYEIQIENVEGNLLKEDELVGTGCVLKIISETKDILDEYKFILYGDVNGDGKINTVDLLVLQRHILDIQKLEGVFYKAGDVSKTNKNPSSIDCLLIQRHILGIQLLEQ